MYLKVIPVMALCDWIMTNFMNVILLWALFFIPLSHVRCLVTLSCALAFQNVSMYSPPAPAHALAFSLLLVSIPTLIKMPVMSCQNPVYLWVD